MKHKIRVAIYMRLSQDVGEYDSESDSIINQRYLLRTYVEKHFDNYELLEFQDDGYTGANFNRPGVSELLDKVKNGMIDCIVVKDLSRFSRDYIEIGSYLEQIFPFVGVRFIAINDGYDSDHYKGAVAGMDTTFKNLINDLYCKDISVKTKSALAIKKEKGIYANGSCTFGYRKDPKDRHSLLIEEEEAAVVRRIFQMTIDGISSHKIAQRFNAEGVKTPIEYKMERGIATMTPKGQHFEWSGSTICHMLRNATYVGDIVYGKYETPEVSGKPRLKPRSEWKVFKNHHEAIVDRDTFDYIQQSRGKKSAVKYQRHPLIGKMECGCCRKSLKIARTKNPYFFCGSRYVTRYSGCVSKVNVQFLEQYILFKLQEEIEKQVDMRRAYMEVKSRAAKELAQTNKEKKQITVRLEQLQTAQVGIYESYVLEEKSRTEYLEEKEKLQEVMIKCMNRLKELEGQIERLEMLVTVEDSDIYVESNSFTKLTHDIVSTFLEKIVVYDEKHIEIEWNLSEKLSEKLLQYQLAIL